MEKEQFYNFEGENSYLEFSGEEDEFDGFIGASVAAVKASKRLKELTNAEEARMAQIEQDLRNSGALPAVAKVKSRATILLEIQRRKNSEVDKLKKDLITAKKANRANAGARAKRLWEDARKKQLEQESLAEAEANAQNAPQLAQPGKGKMNIKLPKGALAKAMQSPNQNITKNVSAGALPESPIAEDVAAPVDESTSTMVTPTVGTNTNEGSEKPNYMLWTGIGLAVLTLGFLAYRKYYTK
jgi:hypothetical protein